MSEKTAMLDLVSIDLRGGCHQVEYARINAALDELTAAKAEIERLRGRVSELEKIVYHHCKPFILRKQAEAVEDAVKASMPGPCGPPDDPPAGYQEYCEGVASVREYAQRLRQQANEPEQ